jgi:fatty acid desaturase
VLGLAFGQIALLGHDAGHRQISQSLVINELVGYSCSFLMGFSSRSWLHNHNLHHLHPNREDHDPDIDFPVVAFSPEQALKKRGWQRWCVRHQAWLFPCLLPLLSVTMRITGARFLLGTLRETWFDGLLFCTHFCLYFWLCFTLLSWPLALLFIVMHHLSFGAYLGMIFAPNHKGMEVFAHDATVDYVLEQAASSRNVRPNQLTDFWYGGLNYQIEHHIFPSMPRQNFKRARPIVRQFCTERGIPYHETSLVQSCREIWEYMRTMAKYAQ